jgi:predicted KAP-like P-loop ATPase
VHAPGNSLLILYLNSANCLYISQDLKEKQDLGDHVVRHFQIMGFTLRMVGDSYRGKIYGIKKAADENRRLLKIMTNIICSKSNINLRP